jgi:hypothetical protein
MSGGGEYDLPFTQKLGMVMSNLDSMRHGRGAMYDPSAMMKLAKDQRDDRLAKESRAKKDEFGRKFAIKAGQLHLWEADRSGYSDAVIGDQYSGIKEEMETSRKREKIKPILEAIKRDGSPRLKKFAIDNPEAAAELYLEERKRTIGYESDPAYQQLQQLFNSGGGGAPEEIAPEETVEESGAAVVGGAPEEGIEEISNEAVDESGAAVVGGVDPNLLSNLQRHYGDPDLTQQEAILIRNAVMANSKDPSAALKAGQDTYDKIIAQRNKMREFDEKDLNNAEDMEKAYADKTKPYDTIEQAAQIAERIAADPDKSAIDKLTVMYQYIKTLDPIGSVREGDTELVAATQSIMARLNTLMGQATEGGGISEQAVQQMAKQMADLGNLARMKRQSAMTDTYLKARARGLDPKQIFATPERPSQNIEAPIGQAATQARLGFGRVLKESEVARLAPPEGVTPGTIIEDENGKRYVMGPSGQFFVYTGG